MNWVIQFNVNSTANPSVGIGGAIFLSTFSGGDSGKGVASVWF
jgi:hypothetical protein